MLVKDLIHLLSTFDPELRIIAPGYEGGYNDLNEAKTVQIALNVNPEAWYGDHELLDNLSPEKQAVAVSVTAVLLT